jgi:biotin-(acetyl-CoA carboxylase) ligase
VNGRDSDKWHSSYGGGLWISYLERMFNLSATAAHSAEGFRFWFGTSMMF